MGPDLSVLVKDYSLHCWTEKHRVFQVISGAYVVFVALGIPVFMATLMVRRDPRLQH